MRAFLAALVCVLTLFLAVSCSQKAPEFVRNDLIYPPAEAAKPFINFDGGGFIIQGKRTYLSSGTMHYARIPHELWADRLMRIRRANFAAVESYVFWNFHEPRENEFDFAGDKDFSAFLETAQQTGLYAIARVGPYVCANWDSGGFPVWLRFKPDMLLRTDDPNYLQWNDHWYEKILPLVAARQINRGGNVVFVQLENEHPLGWGVVANMPYFRHLESEAVKLGIEVPHVMSGLHHRSWPAPSSIDSSKRSNPWFSTEFWTGSFVDYWPVPEAAMRATENSLWTLLVHGAGGHNFFVVVGGSNFESWSDDYAGANWVNGGAVGQAGDLRPIYYRMKRANQLAQSFPEILVNGTDAFAECTNLFSGDNVEILGARRSTAGTLMFLQNITSNEITARFSSGESLRLEPFATYPLPRDVTLTSEFKIVDSSLPVLGVAHHQHAATVIFYGQPGEEGHVTIATSGEARPSAASSSALIRDPTNTNQWRIRIKIPESSAEECVLDQAGQSLRILAISRNLTTYTWFVGDDHEQSVILGPSYVQAVQKTGGKISAIIERPYGLPACGNVAIFGDRDKRWHLRAEGNTNIDSLPAPVLSKWQMSPVTCAAVDFNDSQWMHSKAPQPMGADGDNGAFAWYRTSVESSQPQQGSLQIQGEDNLEVFVNGRHVTLSNGLVRANFNAGKNSVAVFTSHHGRNHLLNYLGSLKHHDDKGLCGPVTANSGSREFEVTGWAMRGGPGAAPDSIANWRELTDTEGVPTFYRASFNTTRPGELGAHPALRVQFTGLSRGMIWVNGHSLGRYPDKIPVDSLYVPECWLKTGENSLIVFDETGADPGQVQLVVDPTASREVIRASEPVDASTPITVPPENPQHSSAP